MADMIQGLEDLTDLDTLVTAEQAERDIRNFGTTGNKIDPHGVDHPAHYNQHPSGVECIDIVEHMGFNIGSAVKYLWRDGLKDQSVPDQDLRKAIWYLQRELGRRTVES